MSLLQICECKSHLGILKFYWTMTVGQTCINKKDKLTFYGIPKSNGTVGYDEQWYAHAPVNGTST